MKKLLAAPVLFFALFVKAETTTYQISGMHCGSCVKMIKSKVCGMDGIEKCDVTLGKLVVSPKEGIKFTQEQVQTAVSAAGDYVITGSKTTK